MRLPHGALALLHEKTQFKITLLSDYAATRKRPGRDRAWLLQEITGIPTTVWQYASSDTIKQAIVVYYQRAA